MPAGVPCRAAYLDFEVGMSPVASARRMEGDAQPDYFSGARRVWKTGRDGEHAGCVTKILRFRKYINSSAADGYDKGYLLTDPQPCGGGDTERRLCVYYRRI